MNTDASGHRQRIRQKYLETGHDSFFDYEKIELLLTFAIPRCDVKPLAKALLSRFGTIAGLLNASREEILSVPGIGENAAILIQLFRGLAADFQKERLIHQEILHCSADVIKYARVKLAGLRKEAFLVIYVNTRNEIIHAGVLDEGTIDQIVIYVRELMAEAIKQNARSIILIHNHPGGTPDPSAADLRMTETIQNAGKSMRVDLLDHIIITHDAAYSILLKKKFPLGSEDSYVIPDSEAAERLRNEKYSRLPFHPRKIGRRMADVAGTSHLFQEGDSEK